ncbi:MAG: hypothetical protein ACRBBS_04900 [Thalassovita sp.]
MADMDKNSDLYDLDNLFAQTRAQDVTPTPDFMERVLQDALQAQVAAAPVAARPRASWIRQLLSAIGGWPAVAGLATAGVAGLWIGINPPSAIATTTENLLGTSSDLYLVDLMPTYDFTLAEG